MNIKSITFVESGKGVFLSRYGLVETENGQEYIYTMEYTDNWSDEEDYFDNIKSDFESESKYDGFGEDEDGLFIKKELWV